MNDKFTLDGRIKPPVGVTVEKAKRAKALFEAARGGSFAAKGQLQELFSSTDIGFTMGHLANIDFISQLPKEDPEEINGLAGRRVVNDFNPVVLRSMISGNGAEGAGVDENGAAAVVPEGTPYPIVTVKNDEESFYSKLSKRGVRFDFTWESFINDIVGFFEELPGHLMDLTQKTIVAEVFDAIDQANVPVGAVTLPDGTTTLPNPVLSAQSIIAATIDLENREINGNKLGTLDDFILLVPKGRKRFVEWEFAQLNRVVAVQDGALTLAPDNALVSLFPRVEIRETSRLTGTAWKLVPRNGTTARPVVEQLRLRQQQEPELRVRSDQGYRPGGGRIDLFEGGFDSDTMSYRYRFPVGGVLWDPIWIASSDGSGEA